MGKKGSELTSFLKNALVEGKYKQHLEWSDAEKLIFIINLPRVSRYSDLNQLKILEDWYCRNDKDNYKDLKTSEDYSKVKQALQMSIKKSVYLENVDVKKFRILLDDEIKDKRKKLNGCKIVIKNVETAEDHINTAPLSVASSGYGSLDENMHDGLEQALLNAPLPNLEDWEGVKNFLNAPIENGMKSMILYKLEWDKVVGNGTALCWELSNLCLKFPDPSDKFNAENPGLYVESYDLLVKLLGSRVQINKINDRLILLLENKAEDNVIFYVEVEMGHIYILPEYFIFYGSN